jgi:hypothetical protein
VLIGAGAVRPAPDGMWLGRLDEVATAVGKLARRPCLAKAW